MQFLQSKKKQTKNNQQVNCKLREMLKTTDPSLHTCAHYINTVNQFIIIVNMIAYVFGFLNHPSLLKHMSNNVK